MDIDPHKSIQPVPSSSRTRSKKKVSAASGEAAPGASAESADEASVYLESSLLGAIRSGLEAMPEVRGRLMDAARDLVGDDDYPSAQQLDELGEFALRQFLSRSDEAAESAQAAEAAEGEPES